MEGVTMRNGQLESPTPARSVSPKRKYVFVVIAALAVVLVIAGVIMWFGYFSPAAREERRMQEQVDRATRAIAEMEEAFRNDTYGGKTPEETLQLFITALEAGDIELASKYFALEDNMNDPDYLTRRKWEEGLQQKTEEELKSVVSILQRAIPDEDSSAYESDYKFIVQDSQGELEAFINMELNKNSGVWKIESL